MDGHYLHLLFNHFPIILSVVAVPAALLGLLGHAAPWRYALASILIAALFALPAMLTGDGAEHAVRGLWYVARGSWHDHEEAAQAATYITLGAGVLAFFAGWRERGERRAPIWLRLLVVAGILASAGSLAYASWLGGKIVRQQPALSTPPAAAAKPETPVSK